MARTLVFDVNETLLDLKALDGQFERIFGDSSVRAQWFALVLRNAMTLTITGGYRDFTEVGQASLQMIAGQRGVALRNADRDAVGAIMLNLPVHEDVASGLDRLRTAGLDMVALTNSPPSAAVAQLTNAGLADHFDRILSVGAVRRFKPDAAVYGHTAAELGREPRDLRMVAAHDWDVAGAMAAGYAGALVTRVGVVANPLFPAPDVVGPDLRVVADRIIEVETK